MIHNMVISPERLIGRTILLLLHRGKSKLIGKFVKDLIKSDAIQTYSTIVDISKKYINRR